ncbi:glyoxalase superfamily protein [Actinokineospora inagensis]|uniref:glyoxalase superfamily protein n=1 Tax=Actinokineospora inagensis TaxID=103730 RepID=UPI000409B4AF|nr:glyoxalase superfamily protein [Actinokineospora inagensis]
MDWKLQVVIVPVADVDRAKEFYADKLGFTLDVDHRAGDHFRVVQVTPPGSACSIVFGQGVGGGEPGSVKGCQFVVKDIDVAARQLTEAGVAHSGVQHFVDGVMTPGPDPDGADFNSFVFFEDPDGNAWAVQYSSK